MIKNRLRSLGIILIFGVTFFASFYMSGWLVSGSLSNKCSVSAPSLETFDDNYTYRMIAWHRGYYLIYTNGAEEFAASALCGGDNKWYNHIGDNNYQIINENGTSAPIPEDKIPLKSREILKAGRLYFDLASKD